MDKSFHIDDWLIQPSLNKVSLGDKSWKIEPKIMSVLVVLSKNRGDVVSREELLNSVWENTVVVDMVVTRAISELRTIFKNNRSNPSLIETIPKKGYRLTAHVVFSNIEKKKKEKPRGVYKSVLWVAFIFLCVVIFIGMLTSSENNNSDTFEIKSLTSLKGWEYNPSISNDGKSVVFVWKDDSNSYHICTKSLDDGSVKTLVSSKYMYFTPVFEKDKNSITYYKNENGKVSICSVPAYGGNEVELIKLNSQLAGLSWSPNGNTLAFVGNDSLKNNSTIKLYNNETEEIMPLTNPPKTIWGDSAPRFSPDGNSVAFIRTFSEGNQDIYIVNLKDKTESRLTSYNSNIYGFDWRNTTSLILSSNYKGNTVTLSFDIHLKEGKIIPLGINNQNPVALNDVFILEKWTQNVDLLQVDLAKSPKIVKSPIISSTKFDLSPSFSHDGKHIVFVSNRSGNYELWTIDNDGKNLKKITSINKSLIGNPNWSPNDELIAFDSKKNGKSNIFLKNIENNDLFSFTDTLANEVAPSWSRNGKWLYFGSDRSGDWEVWKKSVNNGRQIEKVSVKGGYYAKESMDGKYLYYSKFKKSGIWQLDLETKIEERVIDSTATIDYANWALTSSGIFYVKRNIGNFNSSKIKFYDFKSRKEKLIINTSKPIPANDNSITISPDNSTILFGQTNGYDSDLILVKKEKR